MYNYAGVKSKLNFIPDSLLCLLIYIHSWPAYDAKIIRRKFRILIAL